MTLKPHSPAWYDRLATQQTGYFYPWQSLLPAYHGEDIFRSMIEQHLTPSSDVLEVACAQGTIAKDIAPMCQSIVGYDRVAAWIDQAKNMAHEKGLTNTTFLCHDSSLEANSGKARLPADDDAFDLLICSKGPFHWIEDAKRVARQGAVLLMLVPDTTPVPAWQSMLPASVRWQAPEDPNWARPAIEQRLKAGGLALDSWWSYDVPEIFPTAEQLYVWLSWGKTTDQVPPYTKLRVVLDQIFEQHGTQQGVVLRYRRYIWKAVVKK